jgi:cell division protein ZipA
MGPEFRVGERQAVSSSEEAARAELVVGTHPSEDVSHLLPPLAMPPEPEVRDYGPRPWLEFVVDLAGAAPCPRARILSVLTDRALEDLGAPELYGRAEGEEAWTFVRAVGVPDAFADLALGWNLAPRVGNPPDAWELRQRKELLSRLLRPLDRRPRPRETTEAAEERSAELVRLRDNWDVGVALVLRAPWLRRYDTRELWDAAYALGMKWGHLELFHWHNRAGLPGDAHLITLWSVEEPGSFTPEWVAAGMTVPEIALGFSVPRSPDPLGVFDRMVAAGRYFQTRLGGKLLVGQVAIASERTLRLWRGRVHTAATELTAAGFPPGSSKAMQLF